MVGSIATKEPLYHAQEIFPARYFVSFKSRSVVRRAADTDMIMYILTHPSLRRRCYGHAAATRTVVRRSQQVPAEALMYLTVAYPCSFSENDTLLALQAKPSPSTPLRPDM